VGRIREKENGQFMLPTIYMVLDTRSFRKKTETSPVKLRVTFERETVDYQTAFGLKNEHEFAKLSQKHISADLVAIRDSLNKLEVDAKEYAKTLDPFSFPEFDLGYIRPNKLFKNRKLKAVPTLQQDDGNFNYEPYLKKFKILTEQHPTLDSISVIYVSTIKSLIREGRIGSALTYQNSYYQIKKFRGNCPFRKITVSYLREFENSLRSKGRSKGYVGALLRHLRAIFNDADTAKLISKNNCYPFGPGKYIIPSKKKIKEPLQPEDIAGFYYATIEDESILKAIDYWIFLYQGNGMNAKDMALLKFSYWKNGTITFERAKTRLTARENTLPIIVQVTEDMIRIIRTRGNRDTTPDNYIFSFLNKEMNPLEERLAINKLTQFIRKNMKRAFKLIGMDKKSSSQQARYAALNQLRDAGAPTPVIQEMAGHEVPSTTEGYFASVKDSTKAAFAQALTTFKGLRPGTIRLPAKKDEPDLIRTMALSPYTGFDPVAKIREIIDRIGLEEASKAFELASDGFSAINCD
jgi:integrase/recombinase XerD